VHLYAGLPSLMISNIWWACNSAIFKDKMVPPEITAAITLSQVSEFKEDPKSQKQWNTVLPHLDCETPWGYFNGAS
jgi:hypothetical protein